MPQIISCPKCTKPMQVPDDAGGKQVRCPSCQLVFAVAASPAARARQPVGAGVGAPSRPAPAAPSSPSRPPSGPDINLAPTPTECPACKSPLLPGAIACMDCGYLLQS